MCVCSKPMNGTALLSQSQSSSLVKQELREKLLASRNVPVTPQSQSTNDDFFSAIGFDSSNDFCSSSELPQDVLESCKCENEHCYSSMYCCPLFICNCYNIYIRTYIRKYIHTYIHTYIRTYIHTYIHTYIRTYVHTYIHTYIHIYN